ncbi:nuclear transport factor 2 family protein [Denitrificimonas caeni]|uniref:nuclear transport factor 2 family protein n=1 Tax=Denitrificimonas caeni TaxID=521720 RepID=UPI001962F904|nr:nuclear transport factor 2 family protein [Denitrificimonas caeni]
MSNIDQVLETYKKLFESLSRQTVEEEFLQVFSSDVYFKDPFNAVRGLPHLQHIFQHMFATLLEPQFHIIDLAGNLHSGFLEWQFTFKLKEKGDSQLIQGVSKIEINPQGQVCSHIDYWDSGEYVYAKVPLLGRVIALINKRLSC